MRTIVETLIIALVLINFAGFFIQMERPIWAFQSLKRIRSALGFDTNQSISFLVRFLIFIPMLLVLFFGNRHIDSIVFGLLALPLTFVSLLKVLNAIIPPQTKQYAIVTVLDSYRYEGSGETDTKSYDIYMVSVPNLGVRILPPRQANDLVPFHSKNTMSISYRLGGLGFIYRLPFDER